MDRDFEELYRETYRRLVVELYHVVGSVSVAEDVVQEAFARCLRRWDRVRRYDQPAAWVRRVAMNAATSRWRGLRRAAQVQARLAADVSAVGGEDLEGRTDLDRALRLLPVDQRVVLVLYHLVGLSVEEIASQLGVRAGTVKSRLSRGRARLSQLLAVDYEEATP
jgi:RNA polymerase sigma-70 factor (ECF subfamily)